MARGGWFSVLAFLSALLCATATSALAFKQPDSEQTKCYLAFYPFITEIPCAGTGQDGEYTINPLSYTDNGDSTVTDTNTGLTWQQQDDGIPYNWYRASGTYDATFNPEATDVCGSLTLGTYSDWRLPTVKELISIVDYAVPSPGPTIRATYFPNTKASYYWSSTTTADSSINAWIISFARGHKSENAKTRIRNYVRCVRGEQYGSSLGHPANSPAYLPASLQDNGNGTVTDTWTGLVWQQGEPGEKRLRVALFYCGNLSLVYSVRNASEKEHHAFTGSKRAWSAC